MKKSATGAILILARINRILARFNISSNFTFQIKKMIFIPHVSSSFHSFRFPCLYFIPFHFSCLHFVPFRSLCLYFIPFHSPCLHFILPCLHFVPISFPMSSFCSLSFPMSLL